MLQFLKYDKRQTEEAEFPIISGHAGFIFFAKRFGYTILCLYSTIFVAAINPFVNSQYELWVYYIGGILTGFIFLRLCNQLFKYRKFNKGKIVVKSNKIIIFYKKGNIEISADNLQNARVNILGDIIFQEQAKSVSFPLMLLGDNDREKFLSFFDDTAQNRTIIYKKIYDFFEALLVAFILAMHIREYIVEAYYIPTGSMEDTLLVGDHLLVEKITYGPVIPRMPGMDKEIHLNFLGIRKIQRNDIVIFRPPNDEKKDYIKRCIALPGDELHILNNSIYLNGKKMDEPYIKGFTNYDGFSDKKVEGIVPQGNVVVFGDNRENSYDSRGFGYLSIERIKGKAFVLYWNIKQVRNFDFSRFGLIR